MKSLRCTLLVLLFIALFSACADPFKEPTTEPAPTVSYSGNIIFPVNDSYTAHAAYVQVRNNLTGERFQEKIGTGGFFTINDTQGSGGASTSSLYAFYDRNDDGALNYLVDSVAYILTQNNNYSNEVIYAELIELSGTLADSSIANYSFASDEAMSVLKLEDRSYWSSFFQAVALDGSFSVLAVAGHTVDLTLWKVSTVEAGFKEDYSNRLRDPVRLFEPSAFLADTKISGKDGAGSPLGIVKITISYSKGLEGYSDYPLFILAGQNPMSLPVWSSDGSRMTGSPTSTATPLHFYFRQFDRTSSTAGALLDAGLNENQSGYGSFFSTLVFIDTNRDGAYNPGEPASGTYYHGDLSGDWDLDGDIDGKGIPEWRQDNDMLQIGDYSDVVSPSFIDGDLDPVFSFSLK